MKQLRIRWAKSSFMYWMLRFALNPSQFTNLIYVKVSMHVREHMQTYESNLRVVGLWKFLSDIKIFGPWPMVYLSFWVRVYLHAIGRFPCKTNLLLFSRGYNQSALLTLHKRSIDEWCCIAYSLQTMGIFVWRRQCCFCRRSTRLVLVRALPLWKDWLILV